MANHYLHFSEALAFLTIAEREWLERQLETVYVFDDREYTEDEVPESLSIADATWSGCRALRDFPDADGDGGDLGCQYEIMHGEELGWHLWVVAGENGRPEQVAHLIQKFLRQFRPHQSWSLTYATTCSKPRLGEFAGGALFVTAETIESLNAYDFIDDRRAAFDVHHQHPNHSERITP